MIRSLLIAGMLWIACGGIAFAEDLFVTPVFPAPNSSIHTGEHFLMAVQTIPGALCTVDVTVPNKSKVTHGNAVKADPSGAASWRVYTTNDTGVRHVSATCALDGKKVSTEWTYTVQ